MEDKEKTIEEEKTTKDMTEADGIGNGTQPENEEKQVKTFTQEDVDKIVKKRLKDIPSDKELAKYYEWKEAQKTAEERAAEKAKEHEKVVEENTNLKNENVALRAGVNPDDLDYVLFKLNKLDGDFTENLKSFIEENPKYKLGYKEPEQLATGVAVKGNFAQPSNGVTEILQKRHPEINFD